MPWYLFGFGLAALWWFREHYEVNTTYQVLVWITTGIRWFCQKEPNQEHHDPRFGEGRREVLHGQGISKGRAREGDRSHRARSVRCQPRQGSRGVLQVATRPLWRTTHRNQVGPCLKQLRANRCIRGTDAKGIRHFSPRVVADLCILVASKVRLHTEEDCRQPK